MAHFAELDDNKFVLRVISVNNDDVIIDGVESESHGIQFCQNLLSGTWIQTSYNANIRGKFAGIGDFYDEVKDEFVSNDPES
jgi:hypothetical protein